MGIQKKITTTLGLLCLGLPSVALAEGAREIAKKTLPSVVLLAMEDSAGHPIALGSGFFVSDRLVATNLHVIESAAGGYVKPVGEKGTFRVEGTVGLDSTRDLALLRVQDATRPSLPLGESESVAVGDAVYAAGNPQGLEGTFSEGIVSGVRKVGHDTLLQITAPISPGSSGGPVLNQQGAVIGVAMATFTGGQNLNFAVPVSYLRSMIARQGKITPLSATARVRGASSVMGSIGRPSAEGVVAGQMIWNYKGLNIGNYSFSLTNKLRENVRNVVVFYARSGRPLEEGLEKYAKDWRKIIAQVSDSTGKVWKSKKLKRHEIPAWAHRA